MDPWRRPSVGGIDCSVRYWRPKRCIYSFGREWLSQCPILAKSKKSQSKGKGSACSTIGSALRRLGGGRDMLLLMEDDLGSWFLWGPDTSPAPSSLSCVRRCYLLCLLISELVHCGEMWQNTQSPDPECYCHRPDQISKELDSVSTSPSFPFCNVKLHFPLLSPSQSQQLKPPTL